MSGARGRGTLLPTPSTHPWEVFVRLWWCSGWRLQSRWGTGPSVTYVQKLPSVFRGSHALGPTLSTSFSLEAQRRPVAAPSHTCSYASWEVGLPSPWQPPYAENCTPGTSLR